MRRSAIPVLLAAVGLSAWTVAAPAGAGVSRSSASVQTLESGVLVDINSVRQDHGLAPLHLSPKLSAAARQHSAEMAKDGYFSHNSANGGTFDKRIIRYYSSAGRHFWSVGENLLWSSPDIDPAGAVQMWMNSPPHRENLLTARWREIGLSAVHVPAAPGAYGGREVTIVTADFGVRR